MAPASLPIDPHLPGLLDRLEERGALVLSAEPGAGKTTRLPPALLERVAGEVLVLEPRRLAARLAAEHVARERGEAVGGTVGYEVRFEAKVGKATRLRYQTEGVLVRRLTTGAALEGVSAVVLDEFHERHVETDLALVLLERLRRERRPDLRLVVMSATLAVEPVARYLDAAAADVPGRVHPVAVEHQPRRDDRRLEDRVDDAVGRLVDEGLGGHALCFLPGAGEIRRCADALRGLAARHDLAVHPLHGRLDPADTRAALAPSARRKVLLATNVAESSVTIDGVEAVVDSGLARTAGVGPTGLPSLELTPIPKDSARQRANRAGRQGPGRCLRLYTRNDHDRRPAAARPELLRTDLAPAVLALRAAGVRDLAAVRWLDAPPEAAVAQAADLLRRLAATDAEGALTPLGAALGRYPLPPRLARVVEEARRRGALELGCAAAALLSERDIRVRSGPPARAEVEGSSDALALVDLLDEARDAGFRAQRLRPLGVAAGAARRVDRVRRQLRDLARRLDRDGPRAAPAEEPEVAIRLALLAGHPDRVARRPHPARDGLVLAAGGQARLGVESVVQAAEWLVVLDAGGAGGAKGGGPRVGLASAIAPDWLLELFPDDLEEERAVVWSADRERVEASWRLRYGGLVIEESPEDGDPERVAAVLGDEALKAGPEAFCAAERLDAWRRRLAFARTVDPDLPEVDDGRVEAALAELCRGRRSFRELRQADLLAVLQGTVLTAAQAARLERLAPESVTLAGGRRLPVRYERRQPPWVRSRLQDFFGMAEGPAVGGGRVPLVLHLQAPNKQAVSVTSDLAGFWERHYPAARRELGRRYPKHAWPEDPRTAKPPRPGRTR